MIHVELLQYFPTYMACASYHPSLEFQLRDVTPEAPLRLGRPEKREIGPAESPKKKKHETARDITIG